jgi:pilus assembly protein CpaB
MMLMVVAIGCGLAASYMTSRLLADRASHQSDENKVTVVVARGRVSAWIQVKDPEKYFATKDIPESAAPKKALHSLDEVKDQRLSKPLGEDEYVTQDHLVNKELEGMEGKLPAGTRAVAIKVNPECLVGGFVRPASHVDIVFASRGGGAEAHAKTLLQDMLVLAVDTTAQRDPSQPTILGSTVTLAAKPEEIQRLALAQTLGELRLALRATGDTERVQMRDTKVNDLNKPIHDLGGLTEDPQAVAMTPPPVPTLPPTLPPPPPETKPEPVPEVKATPKDEPPVETHTMIIYNGEYVQRAVFVKGENGGWKIGSTTGDDPPRRPPPPPVAPVKPEQTPTTAPKSDPPAAAPTGKPTRIE